MVAGASQSPTQSQQATSLPWNPQDVTALAARFVDAIADIYTDASELKPSRQAKHVFDFADGLRLIVSAAKLRTQPQPRLAVSVGLHMGGELATSMQNHSPMSALFDVAMLANRKLQLIAGVYVPLSYVCYAGGMMHFKGPTLSTLIQMRNAMNN